MMTEPIRLTAVAKSLLNATRPCCLASCLAFGVGGLELLESAMNFYSWETAEFHDRLALNTNGSQELGSDFVRSLEMLLKETR